MSRPRRAAWRGAPLPGLPRRSRAAARRDSPEFLGVRTVCARVCVCCGAGVWAEGRAAHVSRESRLGGRFPAPARPKAPGSMSQSKGGIEGPVPAARCPHARGPRRPGGRTPSPVGAASAPTAGRRRPPRGRGRQLACEVRRARGQLGRVGAGAAHSRTRAPREGPAAPCGWAARAGRGGAGRLGCGLHRGPRLRVCSAGRSGLQVRLPAPPKAGTCPTVSAGSRGPGAFLLAILSLQGALCIYTVSPALGLKKPRTRPSFSRAWQSGGEQSLSPGGPRPAG